MLIKNWKINLLALVLVVIAEFVGQRKIQIGPGFLLFLPMLYALVMGGIISWPKFKFLSSNEMKTSYAIMGSVVMLFVSKLGALLGPSLSQLFHSGWVLSLQELGHFFGTILFGLPIALLLGLKREAVGASFSIDREPNIAIIAEKYGMDSPEGRGVMGTYVCGTLFGALYLGLLAGYIGSTKLLNPISLAMGAGVGSGSMMAAASGAIAAAFPSQAKDIATFAAAANLLTTVIGVYFCLFISLPVANKIYAWWPKKSDKKEESSHEAMA